MSVNKKCIHDFISMFAAQAWVSLDFDITTDVGYVHYLSYTLGDKLSLFPFNMETMEPIMSYVTTVADVVRGVWSTECSGCGSRTVIRKCSELWICLVCIESEVSEGFHRVLLRPDWKNIEDVLLLRPHAVNRNGYAHETLASLILENKDNL